MSQYVQYGAYAFGLMVILLATSVWYALSWRSERDELARAYGQQNWRVRYTKQANPDYYSFMEGQFKDNHVYQWVAEQEEADQKRALAREAAERSVAHARLAGKERLVARVGGNLADFALLGPMPVTQAIATQYTASWSGVIRPRSASQISP